MESAQPVQTRTPATIPASDEQPPKLSREHERLRLFEGKWKLRGKAGTSIGPASAEESYELLSGGFFVVGRGALKMGSADLVSALFIGYDEFDDEYQLRQVDSLGFSRLYRGVESEPGVFTFRGAFERATYRFTQDGRTLSVLWEQRMADDSWKTICDLEGERA